MLKAVTVSFPLLCISPHHFQCFLTAAFFNLIAFLLAVSTAFPQFKRWIRARRCHPPLANCFEKAVTVSFCLFFLSPTITIFFSASVLFICYSIVCAGHTPSIYKGNKGPPPPSPPTSCLRKGTAVSFPPLLIIFFHNSIIFSQHLFFEITANSAEPATLNQLIKGARACHCCLLPRLAWRRQQLWVFLSFLCSPCFLIAAFFN